MTNENEPFGFRLRVSDSSQSDLRWVKVTASNTNDIGQGDPVRAIDGDYRRGDGSSTDILMIASAFKDADDKTIRFLPANTLGFVGGYLMNTKDIYEAQFDSTVINETDKNKLFDISPAPLDTATKRSKFVIDGGSVGTQFLFLDRIDEPNNDFGDLAGFLKVIGIFRDPALII